MINPFFAASDLPYQLPPFADITVEHFRPGLDAGMAEQLAEVEVIAHRDAPPTFDNTIVALERSGRILDRVRRVFWCLTSADTTPELQAIETEYAPRLSAHADAITLDRALFARIDELHAHRDELGLDAESAKLLERYHLDFVRAGAALEEADQDRLRELNAELATLSTEFGVRLLAAAKGSAVHVSDVAELEGLSADAIAAAAETAVRRGLDGYLIELILPTHQPVLTSLHHRELRRRVLGASLGRGSDTETDTSDIVRRMVVARARRAVLLGYPTHSDYVLADRTVGSNARLDETLQQLIPAAVENAHRDQTRLAEALAADTGERDFGAHDWAYYAERIDAASGDGDGAGPDAAVLRPYFELTRTIEEGVFGAAGAVYGLSFRRRADLVGYHPDVVVYEVLDASDAPVGLFLGDFYTRPGKQGGAWMESLVAQNRLLEQLPVVVNNLNLAKPAGRSADAAEHGRDPDPVPRVRSRAARAAVLGDLPAARRHRGVQGLRRIPLAGQRDVGHRPGDAGPLRPARRDRRAAAGPAGRGAAGRRRLRPGPRDDQLPGRDLAGPGLAPAGRGRGRRAVRDIDAFEARVLGEVGLDMAAIPPRYRSRYFNHIFSSGYAAGYYSYLWSEILDADTVEWFGEHRGRLRQAGDVFRIELLSRGGAGDEMGYFEAFRGRPPRIEPLLRRRGLLTG